MLTRTDRRRFPILLAVIAALALAMAMLFSPVQAQEGSAPDKPKGLEATASQGQVVLTWDDPQDGSITGYVILRRVRVNDTGGDFDVLVPNTNTAALTYTDDTVAAGLTYTYRIKAINEHGVSERSRWVHIDTPAAPVPDKPTGLEATATHDSVTLTWDDSQDDSITGYVILRRVRVNDTGGDFDELLANTGTAAITYTDDSVSAETRYTYRIKAINQYGTSERSRWSHVDTPAPPEPAANNPATGSLAITGTAQVGETLTVDTSSIADEDGLENAAFSYQWLADGTAISGATANAYTPVEADEGKAITVQVNFTDDAGNDETLTSAPTAAVAAAPEPAANNPATGSPSITGTPQAGETLTVDTSDIGDEDGLENATFSYQWLADGTAISGATANAYTPVEADEGKAITVQVNFTDDAGNDETLTSAPTEAVAAAPQSNSPATGTPTISGTAQVGETLTADTSGIADADGLANATFSYQWLADDAEIAGATGLTYTLTDSEESKAIKVEVSFTDDADNEETLTSAATGAVAAAQPTEPPAKPTGLEATATHDSVTLTWDDPQDDSIIGYVILRRIPGVDPEGQFSELVPDTGTDATTYTDDTVSAETRYTYRIKAINEHGVSERSRWSHINVPAAPEAAEGDEQGGEGGGGAPGGPGKRANVSEGGTDCTATIATTCEVDVGGSVTGNIATGDDEDWFKVELEADTAYQIDLKGEGGGGGTLEDPFLGSIHDSDGNQILDTANDDIGGEDDILDSRTTYTPTTAGTYYLVAAGAVDDPGTYTLSVAEIACALNEGDIWCGVVDVEDIVSGGSTAGHGFAGTTGDIDGNPDDKDFTVPSNSNEYTITSLLVGAGSNSGNLILRLDDVLTGGDQATLELGIDGESDPFLLSTAVAVGGGGGYRWSGTGLDWSMETKVTVRLREEDPPTLSVADATGDEGDDKVVFTVTLSKPYYAATRATWTASVESGDTAVAADLGTTKTGTVSIAATATTATFEVPVADDTADENDETFTVTLSSPYPTDVVKLAADATAKGTINDDDGTTTSTDATLELLAVVTDSSALVGYQASTSSYTMSVPNSDDEATVTATANHTGATVEYLDGSDTALADANTGTAGHQVALDVGDTAFKVKVTAEDGSTTQTYTVTVTRAAADGLAGTRLEGEEFDLHSDNTEPRGIWSDGTTSWVADSTDDEVYAYALADGTRQDGTNGTTNREFDLHSDKRCPIWGLVRPRHALGGGQQ